MTPARNAARVGAAAFALGLSLAGPQVAVAAADSQDESNPSAASSATSSPAAANRSGAAGRSSAERGTSRAGAGGARGSTAAAGPRPATARRTVPAAGAIPAPVRRAVATADDRDTAGPGSPAPSDPQGSASEVSASEVPAMASPGATSIEMPPAVPTALAGAETAAGVSSAVPASVTPVASRGVWRPRSGTDTDPSPVPSATAVREAADAAVRQAFNALEHRLAALPAGPFSDLLEGALMLVRRSFFNQAPRVVPSPQTTSDVDGTIGGRLGAFDLEGDGLTYTVTGDPQRGTVTVDASGVYTYTPGAEYDGADSFTVKITPERRSFNILNLTSDGSREVTIEVGNPTLYDNPDVAVNIPDTSGHITVTRNGFNQFTGTVTLTNVTAESRAMWIDTSGRLGRITFEALTTNYWEFKARAAENGATVDVTLAYTAADGTQNALLLTDVEMTVSPGGQYVFTGRLAPAPAIETTAVDVWDVIGKGYKPMYENFRKAYLPAGWRAGTVDIDFTGGDFYADTITPLSYERAGLYAQDSESASAANPIPTAAPATPAPTAPAGPLVAAYAAVQLSPVTAALSSGQTVIIGRADGSVELWTDGQKKQLQDAGWNSSVKTLLEYDRPLQDVGGNTILSTFTGTISGTTLTITRLGPGSKVVVGSEIVGAGVAPGTRITKFLDQAAQCADAACTKTSGSGAGGSNGYPGTYEVSISQKVDGAVFTQQDVPAVAAGFIVGLANGAIEMYTSTDGWTELHPYEIGYGGVVSIINYRDGIVVGLDNGAVRQWTGPGSEADPSTWKDNWTELRGKDIQRGTGGAVTALMPYDGPPDACVGGCDGFLVGFADGSISEYSEAKNGGFSPGWRLRSAPGWNSAVTTIAETKIDTRGRPTFAVGLENGAVWQYLWTGGPFVGTWFALRDSGTAISSMVQDGDRFVVGLANGAVLRTNDYGLLTELQGAGWGSAVNEIIPFESAALGRGLVVGLANGSVQAWSGPSNGWVELHNAGWSSGVAAMAPTRRMVINDVGDPVSQDGVIVGLENGTVQQWSGIVSGATGQGDWTELEGIKNAAESVLARKEDWSCSDLRCSQPGALQDAVTFAKKIADGGLKTFGAVGGIGGPDDPIFSDPIMQSPARGGKYYPIAVYKKLSLADYSAPAAIKFEGVIVTHTGEVKCGTGAAECSVLKIPNTVANLDVFQAAIQAGSLLESGTVTKGIQSGTKIVTELDSAFFDFDDTFGGARFFRLSGLPQNVGTPPDTPPAEDGIELPKTPIPFAMKLTQTPSLKVGFDTSPIAYGYVFVPDGIIGKFKAGNWSVGALLAAEIGPSVEANLGTAGSLYAPEKDFPLFEFSKPLGYGTVQLSTGVKVGANVTVNGLPNASTVGAYAYAVPGVLLTYNTVGAPGQFQAATNYYLDVNATAFKDLSGVSLTTTVTPYANLLYGLMIPGDVPLVGGWSIASIGAGFENPLSATVCADTNKSCPAGGTGAGVANFYGVINDGTFTKNVAGKTYAGAGVGNVLTVTQSALFNPTKLAIGQLVKGPGVLAGTTITKYLGSTDYGVQYEVNTAQKTVGGGSWGTHPSLTAYLPGAPVSLTLGSRGLLTFHAGLLEALPFGPTYDAKLPLYEVNYVIAPEAAVASLV